MDRNIVYAGSIPLDTDILSINRNTMTALGYLMKMLLGSDTCVDGLECRPTTPATLSVTVAPGSIASLSVIDVLPFGSLPADATSPLVKMGTSNLVTTFGLTPPTTSGHSLVYLIQAALQEADTNPIVLPYYNAANPAISFSGPENSGGAQNTMRTQRIGLQIKPGVSAPTGSQATPSADSGWTGLYTVTVGYGQTAVDSAAIQTLPGAPFNYWKIPSLRPGFGSGVQTFTTSATFRVPARVTQVEVEIWGAGSGSWASASGLPSGGGSGGGHAKRRITGLIPGQAIDIVAGTGGTPGTVSGGAAGAGGLSRFGDMVSATGGSLNYLATANAPQNGATPPGVGVGGDVNLGGSAGQAGHLNQGGMGGASPLGGAQNSGTTGNDGIFPGGGASGAGTGSNGLTPYNGASGANGLVVIRW